MQLLHVCLRLFFSTGRVTTCVPAYLPQHRYSYHMCACVPSSAPVQLPHVCLNCVFQHRYSYHMCARMCSSAPVQLPPVCLNVFFSTGTVTTCVPECVFQHRYSYHAFTCTHQGLDPKVLFQCLRGKSCRKRDKSSCLLEAAQWWSLLNYHLQKSWYHHFYEIALGGLWDSVYSSVILPGFWNLDRSLV